MGFLCFMSNHKNTHVLARGDAIVAFVHKTFIDGSNTFVSGILQASVLEAALTVHERGRSRPLQVHEANSFASLVEALWSSKVSRLES